MSLIERAAARWGLRDPTVDDVLMEACPEYHVNREHTERYHQLAEQVIRAVADPNVKKPSLGRCEICGYPLVERQRRFCTRRCVAIGMSRERKVKLEPRDCECCGTTLYPSEKTQPRQWLNARYCGDCGRKARYL